jgi:hypothetical protein
MTDKELKIVETEANKQGLELSDLFLLKEIDDAENSNSLENNNIFGGLRLDFE